MLHAVAHSPDEDADAIQTRIKTAVGRLDRGLAHRASRAGIEVLAGSARFLGSREVQIAGEQITRLRFKRAVICTGSTPDVPDRFQGARTVMSPEELVGALSRASGPALVLGHGAAAVEAASLCQGIGGTPLLCTDGEDVLPGVPRQLVESLVATCGFSIETAPIKSLDSEQGHWTADTGKTQHTANLIINAAPNAACNESLDLQRAGVEVCSDGWVRVDQQCRTSEPRVLAAGDCTGESSSAGAAIVQGRIAAEVICGQPAAWDPAAVPMTVFSHPNLCWCGPVDGDDTNDTREIVVPWAASGLAVAMGSEAGRTLLKWHGPSGTVVGGGATGAGACELADAFTVAIELGATVQDLADVVASHPTRSELLFEAARQALAEA